MIHHFPNREPQAIQRLQMKVIALVKVEEESKERYAVDQINQNKNGKEH